MKTIIFVVLAMLSFGASAYTFEVQCNDPIDGRVVYKPEVVDSATLSSGSTFVNLTDGTQIMYPPSVPCRIVRKK